MFRLACVLSLFLWVGISRADEPKTEPPPEDSKAIRLVVANAYLRYLIEKLPNKVGVEPGYTYDLRKKLGLPESMTELSKPAAANGQKSSSNFFAGRLAKVMTDVKGKCDLAMQLPQLKQQLADMNKMLARYGAECKKYSGLNICAELESDLMATGAEALKQAVDGKATMVVLPPGVWEKATDAQRAKLGHLKVDLYFPEVKADEFKLLGVDLGQLELVWNIDELKSGLAANKAPMRKKIMEYYDLAAATVSDEELTKALDRKGIPEEFRDATKAEIRLMAEGIVSDVLNAATQVLEKRDFCPAAGDRVFGLRRPPTDAPKAEISKSEPKDRRTH